MATTLRNTIGRKTLDRVEEAFNKYDRDGSGYLSPGEIRRVLSDLNGKPPTQDDIHFMFKTYDKGTKDGRLSLDEFAEWFDHTMSGPKGQRLNRLLIKDRLGQPRATSYRLPNAKFVYGRAVQPDQYAAGAVLGGWNGREGPSPRRQPRMRDASGLTHGKPSGKREDSMASIVGHAFLHTQRPATSGAAFGATGRSAAGRSATGRAATGRSAAGGGRGGSRGGHRSPGTSARGGATGGFAATGDYGDAGAQFSGDGPDIVYPAGAELERPHGRPSAAAVRQTAASAGRTRARQQTANVVAVRESTWKMKRFDHAKPVMDTFRRRPHPAYTSMLQRTGKLGATGRSARLGASAELDAGKSAE